MIEILRRLALLGRRHRYLVGLILALALIAQWLAIATWIAGEERYLRDIGRTGVERVANSVREQSLRLVVLAAADLAVVDYWLDRHPGIDPRTDRDFLDLLHRLRVRSGNLFDLRLATADGKVYLLREPGADPATDASDRAYFRDDLAAGARELVIGAPIVSRVDGRLGIPLAYRLGREIAGFAVALAMVDVEAFRPVMERARAKPDGWVALFRTDGVLLLRMPPAPLERSPTYTLPALPAGLAVATSERSMAGAPPELVAHSRLEGYPLVVAAGMPAAYASPRWRGLRARAIALAIGLSVLMSVLGIALYAVLGQARASEIELARMAASDSLTGVLNRRGFMGAAAQEFSRGVRYERPLSVLAVDIDNFKAVNDRYGHAAGDFVLQAFASGWQAALRTTDMVGRTGGEEFAILLPETTLVEARDLAERVREVCQKLRFEILSPDTQITVSVGVADIRTGDSTIDHALARADEALYRAKIGGRNRVETA